MSVVLLNLTKSVLARNSLEMLGTESITLEPHLSTEDPLIYQFVLAQLEHHPHSEQLYGDSIANALAVHLLKKYSSQPLIEEKQPHGLSKAQLNSITDFINDNLQSEITLRDLAGLVQLSQYHFCRTFKQSKGMSPYQYVIQQRIEQAKLLLRNGMSISEVALNCGFSHSSHLYRHFKRFVKTTPKKFINS